jgi:protease II
MYIHPCHLNTTGRYFYYYNSGLQQQSVLFSMASLDAEPRLLLDPNTLSSDGTVALTGAAFSDDGSMMAYSLSSAGSDWNTIQVGGCVFMMHGGSAGARYHDQMQNACWSCNGASPGRALHCTWQYAAAACGASGLQTVCTTNQGGLPLCTS